ncbi:hypothetical protein Dsin_004089 [Dipteronia sinensis]|uniref:Uncharacterized protein n=1 Tax=Dipteronia sinensis TaxID=43782 RepID=A0AAE0EKV1_9ROSI|nr:hypothetical protein Dsin_004089 [Dipteronia sinensis]
MCTLEKRGNLYSLTLVGPISSALIDAIRSALRRVTVDSNSSSSSSSSALITTNQGKFFSNGLDLALARSLKSNPGPTEETQLIRISRSEPSPPSPATPRPPDCFLPYAMTTF